MMTPHAFDEDFDPYAGQLNHLRLSGMITGDEEQELLDPFHRFEES